MITAAIDQVLARWKKLGREPRGGPNYIGLCPCHPDRRPSLRVLLREGEPAVIHCFAGCDWREVRAALQIDSARPGTAELLRRTPRSPPAPTFTASMAAAVWAVARRRARCDDLEVIEEDKDVCDFLADRGLVEALAEQLVGILADPLPDPIGWWADAGYRLALPLFSKCGELRGIQARNIDAGREPRLRSPPGADPRGVLFANPIAQAHLRGQRSRLLVLGEGLTDHLALSIAAPDLAVLAVPGVAYASRALGLWVHGVELVLAIDQDERGIEAAELLKREAPVCGAKSVRDAPWRFGLKDACAVLRAHGIDALREDLGL